MSISPEKYNLLKQLLSKIDDMKAATLEIMDGKPEAAVLRKYEINKAAYRNLLFRKTKFREITLKDYTRKMLTPEEKLYISVFGKSFRLEQMPLNSRETVNEVLSKLPREEELVVRKYLYEDYNFSKIGRQLNITDSAASHAYDRAICKLKRPSTRCVLLQGVAVSTKHKNNIGNRYNPNVKPNDVGETEKAISEMRAKMVKADLYECGFSTRLYNLLRRNGINHIEDLYGIRSESLRDYNGMGDTLIGELYCFLKDNGFAEGTIDDFVIKF